MRGSDDLPSIDNRSDAELLEALADDMLSYAIRLRDPWAKSAAYKLIGGLHEFRDDFAVRAREEAGADE